MIQNQETSAQQVQIVEDDTNFNVAEKENNETANKDTFEKDLYTPHFIEEKRTHSLLPTTDTKGDRLCL